MNTAEIIKTIRINHHLTQDEMAQKLYVTRQAVSEVDGEITFCYRIRIGVR